MVRGFAPPATLTVVALLFPPWQPFSGRAAARFAIYSCVSDVQSVICWLLFVLVQHVAVVIIICLM